MKTTQILVKTFVLGANHGQLLQALGLKQELQKSGDFSIYHPFYHNHIIRELIIHFRSLTLLKYIRFLLAWRNNFDFTFKDLQSPIVIYGSDMIWHLQSKLFPADRYYFSKNSPSEYSISFAPSTSYRDLKNEPYYCNEISKFNHVSVRDQSTYDFAAFYGKTIPSRVCDPALFLDASDFLAVNTPKRFMDTKAYAIIYGHKYKFSSLLSLDNIEKSLETIVFEYGYYSSSSFYKSLTDQLYSPLAIFNVFLNSKFILTSTFHGFIVALLTKKPFILVPDLNLLSRISFYQSFFDPNRIISPEALRINSLDITNLLQTNSDIRYDNLALFVSQSRLWLEEAITEGYKHIHQHQ